MVMERIAEDLRGQGFAAPEFETPEWAEAPAAEAFVTSVDDGLREAALSGAFWADNKGRGHMALVLAERAAKAAQEFNAAVGQVAMAADGAELSVAIRRQDAAGVQIVKNITVAVAAAAKVVPMQDIIKAAFRAAEEAAR